MNYLKHESQCRALRVGVYVYIRKESFFYISLRAVYNPIINKIYLIRPKPGPVAKNATPRPSGWEWNPRPLGMEPACSTTELQKPLPTTWARVEYIYIYTNDMVMPAKYKGILIIIFGICTRCQ